jgi:hypothetical protein
VAGQDGEQISFNSARHRHQPFNPNLPGVDMIFTVPMQRPPIRISLIMPGIEFENTEVLLLVAWVLACMKRGTGIGVPMEP